jgi:hypothetical protein
MTSPASIRLTEITPVLAGFGKRITAWPYAMADPPPCGTEMAVTALAPSLALGSHPSSVLHPPASQRSQRGMN